MTEPPLPTIDLVVATVDRTDDLARLLDSLARQTYGHFRVLLVDQNDDARVEPLLTAHPALEIVRLESRRGLSAARNIGLGRCAAEIVGFPDDDCSYPGDLLAHVAARFAGQPGLDGLSGRPADQAGRTVGRWPGAPCRLDLDNVWHCANSHTIFLRRSLAQLVGDFDESLGLGAGTPWSSGEETDYLVRALRAGARIEYDPTLVVLHPVKPTTRAGLKALGRRDGGSVGYILGRNDYPPRAVARMLVRPAGGALLSLLLGDRTRAGFHAATLRGRLRGYRAGRLRRATV